MEHELGFLIKLQEIDLRIRELEQSKIDLPDAVAKLERAIHDAEGEVERIAVKLADLAAEQRALTATIADATAALDKSQQRLGQITTNREYDAVHAEIESHNASIAGAQNRITAAAGEIEKLTAQHTEAQEKLQAVKNENEPQIAELKEKVASIDSRIAEIVTERTAVLPKISKHFLSTYDFIRKKRKSGSALSVVDEARTCAVCFKVLEPQLVNEVKRGTRLLPCQSCGSLLVWSGVKKEE